ncbi:MAG: hypothetical protein K6C30_08660 [Bacteroidaceae bacterium]|nr:hypothetical protein [Bacteroidaceae bacterium]
MNQTSKYVLALALVSACVFSRASAQDSSESFEKFRLGGYGEMTANFKDYGLNRFYGGLEGSPKQNHNTISIPRFILAGDYKFNSRWQLGFEVEFESGGTGVAYELETGQGSENLEYETEFEKGGEVALEQFHITRFILPELNVRAGHLIVPVGLTNTHHEPINFFGTSRPEGETTILPCTWHETGLELFGKIGSGYTSFDYQAQVVAGLNPNGFNIYNWLKGGKQGLFEDDNFTRPAYVARVNYTGVKGLRVGGSIYYNHDAGKNADRLTSYDAYDPIDILIWNLDAQYVNRYVTARLNYLRGNVTETTNIQAVNRIYSNKSPYSRKGAIAQQAVTYSAEVGVNLKSVFSRVNDFPVVYPFVHYNYYNPQEKGEGLAVMDDRCQVSMWTIGANWKPLPNLVVKANYMTRQIGTNKVFGSGKYNSENEFAVGVAYVGWFFKK